MNLKDLRKSKGLTLKTLSKLTGVSAAQLSRLERKKRGTSLKTLLNLAYVLKVQPAELIEPIDFAPPFDHKIPDQCPFAVDERPSSCSECPNSGACPFFTYEEEEDDNNH